MEQIQNRIVVINGRKGTGKTTLLKRFARLFPNPMVLDIFGEFGKLSKGKFLAEFAGFHLIRFMEKLKGEYFGFFGGAKPNLRFIYSPKGGDQEFHLLPLMAYQDEWFKKAKKESSIIIDEVDLFMQGNQMSPLIDELVKRGRHVQLNQVYSTRRPHELSRLISSQADDFFIFNTQEPRDLEYFRKILPEEYPVERLKTLKTGEYIHYNIAENKVGEMTKNESFR